MAPPTTDELLGKLIEQHGELLSNQAWNLAIQIISSVVGIGAGLAVWYFQTRK